MGLSWRRRRDNGKAFVIRPKGGKSVSQMLNKRQDEPLTASEITKVLRSRRIEKEEIIPEEEIKMAQAKGQSIEGRLVSLHPSNPELDNVFVDEDSPHLHDESELNKGIDLREQQNRMVAEDKGLDIQEDIDKMREQENNEKAKE
ncbi:MAG: hypothetical protein KJI69_03885 [Patescibacteria group bacterium]|nr:hypothetical protein [Patescibacteria group bacterium]